MAANSFKINSATRAINQYSVEGIVLRRQDYLSVDAYLGRDYDNYNDKVNRKTYPEYCLFLGYTNGEFDNLDGHFGLRWNA